MRLVLDRCEVRSWRSSDAESIARHANNRKIWLNLRDAFPHPYTLSDARQFLKRVAAMEPETFFAIAVGEEAVGSIGFRQHEDVERCSAEIGYWLAEDYWGRGITTAALTAVTEYAINRHGLTRVYAVPFEHNHASFRVLEKAGYVCEGRMRSSAIKDGKVVDQLMYAFVPNLGVAPPASG
jgi:ribosomal-protein-alanine N-acetyltransferase